MGRSDPNKDFTKRSILDGKVKESLFGHYVSALREEGIESLALKGWSLARFYPDPSERTYSDIDIAVSPEEYARAQQKISDAAIGSFSVDLHEGLRDRDHCDWNDLFSRSYVVELHGVPVRVLADEDNLRVTASHWLLDGGVYRDKLWDVYYLVHNRKPSFDWKLCLEASGSIRKTWVLAAVATARDFLDLDVSGLPTEVRDFKLPSWYVFALKKEWKRGPYLRIPLSLCIRRPKLLFEQLHRRFPPNSIAATTDTEGPIDDTPRWPYQVKSILKKLRNASPFGQKG